MKAWILATGGLVLGLLVGGVAADVRYRSLDDKRTLCASCHHGAADLADLDAEAPHSVDFNAGCHSCHVLPVKQYLDYAFESWGFDAPAFVGTMENPTFGGQTCLECHLARGRGVLACEQCHASGEIEVRFDQRCEVCHTDRTPLHPHTEQACRHCHVEVFFDPDGRAQQLMHDKLTGTRSHRP